MPGYTLSRLAERDLLEIWEYTANTWSEAQADSYLAKLDECCMKIAAGSKAAQRPIPGLDDVRVARCQRHYIFFLAEKPPLVIAILHEKMDCIARLRSRLSKE